MLRRLAVSLAAALCAAAGVAAPAGALTFTPPAPLPDSLPSAAAQRGGGEPSAIIDPGGANVYVASPGAPDHGGNFWRSTNAGATFSPGLSVGTARVGGGDSDLALGFDAQRTLFYIDLEELVAADLCRSTDQGQSFPSCSTGFPPTTNQQEPIGDRPWLNTVPGKPGLVYGTYDGLAYGGGAPEVQQSTDNGNTFLNCGQVLQPGSSALAHFSPTGAAENSEVIGKPAVGPDGTIYVPFTEPHTPGQQASSSDPTRSNLYLGVSKGGCPAATSAFHDTSVWENDQGAGSDFVSLFPSVGVDGAGTVYVLGTGQLAGDQKGDGVYLFISHDGGQTFPTHTQVNQGSVEAAQLAALDVGKTPGDVLVGWYASQANPDHNSTDGRWRYFAARSSDGGQTFPQRSTVTPDVMHYGAVCNVGVLCTSGRNLLDFTTVAINPVSSCAFAVFAGDPFNTPGASPKSKAAGYTALQNDGACAASAAPAAAVPGATQGVGSAARPRLRLAVTPRIVAAGTCRRYTFHVTTRTAGKTRNVSGATVRYAGGQGRTNAKGVTRFTRCVRTAGRHPARASRAGYAGASASVLARAARASVRPHFTG